MTERLWLFPAILCLLLSAAFFEVFSLLGLILSVIWFIRILLLKNRPLIFISLITSVLFISVGYYHQQSNHTSLKGDEEKFIVFPHLTSIKVNGNNVRFDGTVQRESFEERVVVSYYVESEEEQKMWLEDPPVSQLIIKGELTIPGEQSNFNQFNYRKYLNRKQIYWQLQAEEINEISHTKLNKPKGAELESLRYSLFQYVDRTFHTKTASYIKILFFADNRSFSENVLSQYRSLGIVHLLSISGFHISYLVGVIRQLLLRLGITHERTNLLLLILLPMYGCLAGLGVSVFRAVVQSILVIVSRLRNRPMDTLDAWSLTMILALLIQPTQIYNISFQLSYTLSGLFILMGQQKWIKQLNTFQYSLLFSLMSGLASLPILSYHFFEISWVSIFSNLLFIPFFSNVFFPMLLFLFMSSLIMKQSFFFHFIEKNVLLIVGFVEQSLSLFTSHINFSFITGRLPDIVMLLLIISIFNVLKKIENKEYPQLISVFVIIVTLFYHQLAPVGYVLMLDVGQGDSILIKEPRTGKITLIDTGGRLKWDLEEEWKMTEHPFSIGGDIVVPSLKSLGVSKIDRLYLTHADADHSGEIENIAKLIEVKEIATTKETFQDDSIYNQVNQLKKINQIIVKPPGIMDTPVKNTVAIHPKPNNFYQDKNNQSLVLYVTLGEDKWLFTGDIEKEAEKDLILEYPNLKTDYLKVSHHGSQTSSTVEFVQHVDPKVALVSVGEDNQFGHPNKDVMERFKDMEVYLTSVDGAIMHRYLKLPFTNYWIKDVQTVHKN